MGLGCMGMSEFYGPADHSESRATLEMAVDRGVSFLDTADMYGAGKNEELLADILRRRRKEIVLATKVGIVRDAAAPTDATRRKIDGKPGYVRSACDASLRRLGVEHIDLYYQHRVDRTVPIEDTVGAMAELVAAGKVRFLGLSEPGPDTVRRAHATHPISALQNEWFWVCRCSNAL
jgi:aryl-alcohol dehydrogenase-like predicted oxidoreductase